MQIRIGQWEIEIGVRKMRPLIGGTLDVQAELAAAYSQIRRPRRRKSGAR